MPLDAWIIEEIKRRELERQEQERPRVELPLEAPRYEERPKPQPPSTVITIQL